MGDSGSYVTNRAIEGRGKVEGRYANTNWEDATDASYWNFREMEYRAKHEPLVIYVVWCKDTGNHRHTSSNIEEINKKIILCRLLYPSNRFTIKKFIEEI